MQYTTVNNSIITLGNTDGLTSGRRFESRFLQPGLAGYPGQYGNALIRKESLDKFINTLINKPVIINHQSEIAEKDKAGEVLNVWFNPDDGWYWCSGVIYDNEAGRQAQNLIKNRGWSVSCSYSYTKSAQGGTENNIPYDIEFLDGEFEHLAIVENPRYERANIVFNAKEFITVGEGENKHPIPIDYVNENLPQNIKTENLKTVEFTNDDINKFKEHGSISNFYKENIKGKEIIHEDKRLGTVYFDDDGLGESKNINRPKNFFLIAKVRELVKESTYDREEPPTKHERNDNIAKFHLVYTKAKMPDKTRILQIKIAELKDGKKYYFLRPVKTIKNSLISAIAKDVNNDNSSLLIDEASIIIPEISENKTPDVKEYDMVVNNGFITTDKTDENGDRIVIWIPENVHYVPPKERSRVLEIAENYKQGADTKYDFTHTRVKPTAEQIKYLKDTVSEIENDYKFKGIAQIEISSSLNSGSYGVCFSPNNTSLISLSPQLYNGRYTQDKRDAEVKAGWFAKGTGDAVKSVLVHEIGHAITCNSKNEEFWSAIDKIRGDYLKNIKKEDINNPDFISNYARTNKYEFAAEAFCQGRLSKKYGKYTEQVMAEINKHFNKTVQRKLFNAKDDEAEMWIEGWGFGYPESEKEYEKFRAEVEKQQKTEKKAKNSLQKIINNALAQAIADKVLNQYK